MEKKEIILEFNDVDRYGDNIEFNNWVQDNFLEFLSLDGRTLQRLSVEEIEMVVGEARRLNISLQDLKKGNALNYFIQDYMFRLASDI